MMKTVGGSKATVKDMFLSDEKPDCLPGGGQHVHPGDVP
jgi:hypothetical protein